MIDAVVVGGGPVGLVSALCLQRAGLSVTVLEQRDAPIDKACGEGLMPAAVRALAELGVPVGGHELTGIRYQDGRRSVLAEFRSGPGRGVRRTELQASLDQAVRNRGILIERASAAGVAQDDRGIEVAGLRARYLVAADGLHSGIRRGLGLGTTSRRRSRWGQRQHCTMPPWSDAVEVHWAAEAEAYVTPVAADQVGVAVLSARRAPFEDLLAGFPELQARLAGVPRTRVQGAGPLRQPVRRRRAGRVLLVGDAAGYVDALTGEGMAVGFECAARLARCLAADRPERYEREWRQATRRYRLLTEGLLLAAGIPVTRRLIVPSATRMPRLYQHIVDQLAG